MASNRGAALLVTLITLVVLVLFCAGYMSMVSTERRMTNLTWNSTVAINVAEAGIEAAIWEFEYGGEDFLEDEGWAGEDPKTMSDTLMDSSGNAVGDYTVSASGFTFDTRMIDSTGFVPTQAQPLVQRRVVVELSPNYIFPMAAFGLEGVKMDSNATTDSFDSRLGLYGGGNVGSNGDIGTNATSTSPPAIWLSSNALADGDAFCGPEGDPEQAIVTQSSSDITGSEEPLSEEQVPFYPTPPSGLIVSGSISLSGVDTMTISGNRQYSSIYLDGDSILTIDANSILYITGTLEMESNSQVHITNGAEVDIYVDGRIYMDSNTQVNNTTKDPTKLTLYGTAALTDDGSNPGVELDSNADFYGAVYAPNATIEVDSNASMCGALFGKYIHLDSNAQLHFDEALNGFGAPYNGFKTSSWQEM